MTSLNTRSGWAGELEAVLQALHQGNVNNGVLQEKNLAGGIHTSYIAGYRLCAREAESRHRGGIVIVL